MQRHKPCPLSRSLVYLSHATRLSPPHSAHFPCLSRWGTKSYPCLPLRFHGFICSTLDNRNDTPRDDPLPHSTHADSDPPKVSLRLCSAPTCWLRLHSLHHIVVLVGSLLHCGLFRGAPASPRGTTVAITGKVVLGLISSENVVHPSFAAIGRTCSRDVQSRVRANIRRNTKSIY